MIIKSVVLAILVSVFSPHPIEWVKLKPSASRDLPHGYSLHLTHQEGSRLILVEIIDKNGFSVQSGIVKPDALEEPRKIQLHAPLRQSGLIVHTPVEIRIYLCKDGTIFAKSDGLRPIARSTIGNFILALPAAILPAFIFAKKREPPRNCFLNGSVSANHYRHQTI